MDLDMDLNEHGESDSTNGDGEGVWSPDIEQCFREALLLFPPCGRRKHILQEEGGGKMYGRNELIARHIMMRTGKSRTRKQVSSHIQVLARRKAKAEASATISGVSPSPSSGGGLRSTQSQPAGRLVDGDTVNHQQQTGGAYYDVWTDRPIVTNKIRFVEFSAFIEHRNFQSTNHQQSSGVTCAPIIATAANSNNLTSAQHQPPTSSSLPACAVIVNQDLSGSPIVGAHSAQATNLMQPYSVQQQPPQQQVTTTHPLASNHQLPAQFNQATNYHIANNNNGNQLQQSHHQQQLQHHHHQHKSLSLQGTTNGGGGQGNHFIVANNQHPSVIQQAHQSVTTSGFIRHSYVQIDYSQPLTRQPEKIERIDISQIQDKFPEISGSEGLYQRGPSDAFFLVKFWADLNNDYEYNIEDQNSYFGFSSHFETIEPFKDITCSTKACSYGLQVVEKVEKIYGAFNSSNGRYSYDINKSPMCEFMIQFIKKLRQLPRASQMNSVLENFTVLQVITSESTSEILLCLAYVFEVASPEQNQGPQYHVYRLTKD